MPAYTVYSNETGHLDNAQERHANVKGGAHVSEIVRFSRIRLLTEPGYPFYDVSYVYGIMADGSEVRVHGMDLHRLGRKTYRSQIADECKRNGANANALGVWSNDTYSKMW